MFACYEIVLGLLKPASVHFCMRSASIRKYINLLRQLVIKLGGLQLSVSFIFISWCNCSYVQFVE